MNPSCQTCSTLNKKPQPIFTTDYWIVLLAPDQGYLGRCYVTLRTHKERLRNLTAAEWQDFGTVVNRLEQTITKSFGAKLFNWASMMNNAYQADVPIPHVHWHVRPRYDQTVEFAGLEFTDKEFGFHYDREQRFAAEPAIIQRITDRLLEDLKTI